MKRVVWLAVFFVTGMAQDLFAAEEHLTDQQQLGRRIFEQSCGVCHTRPTLTSGLYGPELSRETAGGNEEVVRGVISNGTPRMPGFKITYSPDQIAAVAAYIKTMPPGTQDLPTPRPAPAADHESVTNPT